jgi:hypothetical protein
MKPELRDSDIERELRRRAASVRTANGWATESLLPTVRATIETQPQRVPVARLAWLGGLAALFGVLLILAVALPRLVDGPAASPTADPAPVVLSTEEFASKLTNAELDGSTVLVQGRIGPDLRRGPGCFLTDGLCRLGQLDGVEPEIEISSSWTPTVEDDEARTASGGAGMWQWWYMPRSAVEGILALSVRPDGAIEFLGRVHSSETTLAWAAGDVAELDVKSLELDELVLVDGWLTQVPGAMSCRPPDPGEVVPGLPSKYCGNSAWIAPEPVPIDPQGFTIPDDFVPVQHGAYFEFAEGPVADEGGLLVPRRATYGLARRLYGGGCPDGEPPCWDWRLIGRVSTLMAAPSSTPEASATPSPEPSQLPMSPSLAPPPIEPEPSPSPSPRTLITCLSATRPDTEVAEPLSVTVEDETGLVTGCTAIRGVPEGIDVEAMGFDKSVFVRNSPGDTSRLAIMLGGLSLCDRNAAIGLRQSADRYQLNVDLLDSYSICRLVPVSQSAILELREPLSADLIDAILTGPSAGSPSPSPAPATALSCPYVVASPDPSSEGRPIDVTLTDNTGLVASCAAGFAPSPGRSVVAVRNLEGNLSRLEVSWTVTSMCDYMPAELQLWQTESGHLVSVNQPDTGDRPLACLPAVGGQAVVLTLREPLPADQVETMLMSDGVGQAAFEMEPWGESITLTLQADDIEYAADEPIDIEAVLSYEGRPSETIRLVGSTSGLVAFGARQFDGELAMGPGWDDACRLYDVASGEPTVLPYVKSAGWSADDPNAAFYASWAQDPELKLPPGVWQIKGVGQFALEECGGTQVSLEASIIIRVR